MAPLQELRDGLTDDSLRFAILAGLASLPVTLALSWEPIPDGVVVLGGSIQGVPLLLAGLLVGYWYSDRDTEPRRAGIWTGLAGSIATVLVYVANTATTVASASPWVAVLAVVTTPIVLALGVGLSVVVATVGALIGDAATKRVDPDRRVLNAEDRDGRDGSTSRWWRVVAVYALAAPVVLGYSLVGYDRWFPDHGVGFALAALGSIALVIGSIVTLVALFVDATAPRDAETGWFPNVWVYVGTPLGAFALVSLEAVRRGSANPAGDGTYGFLVALWVVSVVYLVGRRRHGGAIGSASLEG